MKKIALLPIILLILAIPIFAYTWIDADFNKDGYVNLVDHSIFGNWYGNTSCNGNNSWCEETDINEDGIVNLIDYSLFGHFYGCTWNSSNESGC